MDELARQGVTGELTRLEVPPGAVSYRLCQGRAILHPRGPHFSPSSGGVRGGAWHRQNPSSSLPSSWGLERQPASLGEVEHLSLHLASWDVQ